MQKRWEPDFSSRRVRASSSMEEAQPGEENRVRRVASKSLGEELEKEARRG